MTYISLALLRGDRNGARSRHSGVEKQTKGKCVTCSISGVGGRAGLAWYGSLAGSRRPIREPARDGSSLLGDAAVVTIAGGVKHRRGTSEMAHGEDRPSQWEGDMAAACWQI
jgi:hypothetical protein